MSQKGARMTGTSRFADTKTISIRAFCLGAFDSKDTRLGFWGCSGGDPWDDSQLVPGHVSVSTVELNEPNKRTKLTASPGHPSKLPRLASYAAVGGGLGL